MEGWGIELQCRAPSARGSLHVPEGSDWLLKWVAQSQFSHIGVVGHGHHPAPVGRWFIRVYPPFPRVLSDQTADQGVFFLLACVYQVLGPRSTIALNSSGPYLDLGPLD